MIYSLHPEAEADFGTLPNSIGSKLAIAFRNPCWQSRVLGHTQANTTYRYVNANVETAKRAAAALNAFNAEATEAAPAAELVH